MGDEIEPLSGDRPAEDVVAGREPLWWKWVIVAGGLIPAGLLGALVVLVGASEHVDADRATFVVKQCQRYEDYRHRDVQWDCYGSVYDLDGSLRGPAGNPIVFDSRPDPGTRVAVVADADDVVARAGRGTAVVQCLAVGGFVLLVEVAIFWLLRLSVPARGWRPRLMVTVVSVTVVATFALTGYLYPHLS